MVERQQDNEPRIELRPASMKEYEAIKAANRQTLAEHRAAFPFAFHEDDFETYYKIYIDNCFHDREGRERDADGIVQAVFYDDAFAGYVILTGSSMRGSGLAIFDIHVFEPYRGKGLGLLLLDWCKTRAGEFKAHNLDAHSWALGGDRGAFFAKAGFTKVHECWRYGSDASAPALKVTKKKEKPPSRFEERFILWGLIAILAVALMSSGSRPWWY